MASKRKRSNAKSQSVLETVYLFQDSCSQLPKKRKEDLSLLPEQSPIMAVLPRQIVAARAIHNFSQNQTERRGLKSDKSVLDKQCRSSQER
ncbi:hypothetical protein ACROYT_G014958 [Oculina patagonica]